MKRLVTAAIAAIVVVLCSADIANALPRNGRGPLGHMFSQKSGSVTVTRNSTHTRIFGATINRGCAGGNCANSAAPTVGAKTTTTTTTTTTPLVPKAKVPAKTP